jgi:hypothetical protein
MRTLIGVRDLHRMYCTNSVRAIIAFCQRSMARLFITQMDYDAQRTNAPKGDMETSEKGVLVHIKLLVLRRHLLPSNNSMPRGKESGLHSDLGKFQISIVSQKGRRHLADPWQALYHFLCHECGHRHKSNSTLNKIPR